MERERNMMITIWLSLPSCSPDTEKYSVSGWMVPAARDQMAKNRSMTGNAIMPACANISQTPASVYAARISAGADVRKSEWSVVPARTALAESIQEKSQQADDEEFRQRKITSDMEDLGSRAALQGEKDLIWYPAEVNTSIRPGWFYHTKEDNQVLDRILNARKTCRAFAENVPTDDEIKEVIQAGCIAPYASIDAKAVTPFRHFFVIKKDDPKMEQIDAFIRQQSQVDLDARIKEEETDPFLKENGEGVKKLWKHVAECGESTFPNPPCLIIAAEWRGARRAEHQSLAHMMQNMWIKATALNLDFQIISVTENMVNNQDFCDMLGLPVGRYGFLACVLGYAKDNNAPQHPRATTQIHWL